MRRTLPPQPERIPITQEGYDKLLKEQEELLAQRPDAIFHLQKSRELGDLRENGYYSASRQKVNAIDARLRKLKFMIKYALIIEGTSTDSVDIGTTVTLNDGEREFEYKIVGEEEADPREGKISFKSPLGHALLGKKVNEKVDFHAPAGLKTFQILKLS